MDSRKQLNSDKYCWSCHRNEPDLYCNTCVRSFHVSSLCSHTKGLTENKMITWQCPECIDIANGAKQNKAEKIDAKQLKKALDFIFKQLTSYGTFTSKFMNIDYPRGKVANKMDFNTIGKKIEIGAYSCCEDFWSDIKWIVHNTKSFCSADHDSVKAAKDLFNAVKAEMYSIRMCNECYLNMNDNWFEMPCSKLHIVVWAKQRTYPYWPAKVMRYNGLQNTVDVWYFGNDHLRAVLPEKDCLLYSKCNPSTLIGKHKKSLEEALEEAERYIENITKKYGKFNHAAPLTYLHGNSMERHLYDMIPGAWKQLGRSDIPPPIPKTMPASATNVRRMSLPLKEKRQVFAPPPLSDITSGRIMTRRMSAIVADKPSMDAEGGQIMQKVKACRRLSVQVERLSFTTITGTNLSSTTWNISHNATNDTGKDTMAEDPIEQPQSSAKKRRMSVNSSKPIEPSPEKCAKATGDATTSQNLLSDSVFKVPPVPTPRRSSRPAKKSTETAKTGSVANDSDSNVSNEHNVSWNEISSSSSVESAENQSEFDQATAGVSSPKPSEQSASEQQSTSDRETKEAENTFKLKFEAVTAELEKAQAQITEANEKMSAMMTKNTYLNATITKLQAENIESVKKVKANEAKNVQLINTNKKLMLKNNKWCSKIEQLSSQNRNLNNQVRGLQRHCDLVKIQVRDQYEMLLNDVKKRQWCATCHAPGVPYYCSPRCQPNPWHPYRPW